MSLSHLNLTVTDVPAARRFLEAYFGLQARSRPGRASRAHIERHEAREGLLRCRLRARGESEPHRHTARIGDRLRAIRSNGWRDHVQALAMMDGKSIRTLPFTAHGVELT
jgi:hypothetical protein